MDKRIYKKQTRMKQKRIEKLLGEVCSLVVSIPDCKFELWRWSDDFLPDLINRCAYDCFLLKPEIWYVQGEHQNDLTAENLEDLIKALREVKKNGTKS